MTQDGDGRAKLPLSRKRRSVRPPKLRLGKSLALPKIETASRRRLEEVIGSPNDISGDLPPTLYRGAR